MPARNTIETAQPSSADLPFHALSPAHYQIRSPRILIIDKDFRTTDTFTRALRQEGCDASVTVTVDQALTLLSQQSFDLILLDLRLPDNSWLALLRILTRRFPPIPIVAMNGDVTTPVIFEAMEAGAIDVIERPHAIDDIIAVIRKAIKHHFLRMRLAHTNTTADLNRTAAFPVAPTCSRSIAERWAAHVMNACRAEVDLRTLESWARFVGVGHTSLCESCRLLSIRPLDARDLTRCLRALVRSAEESCHPEVLLDVSDRRTLDSLLDRAGPHFTPWNGPDAMVRFLEAQRFVPAGNAGLKALSALAARSASAAWKPATL